MSWKFEEKEENGDRLWGNSRIVFNLFDYLWAKQKCREMFL